MCKYDTWLHCLFLVYEGCVIFGPLCRLCFRVVKWHSSKSMVAGGKNTFRPACVCEIHFVQVCTVFQCGRSPGHRVIHGGASLNTPIPSRCLLDTAPCVVQTLSWNSYLHVAAPLGFPFQQGIQDSPAGLLSSRVVPTHHVVGRPHSLEKFNVDILTIAMVGNIA